ncbi:MAG: tail fiber domain-containing protein [Chitinophagaceae bacterium]|nr:tail fiber domain-containing protein [Chitinophagaceae bacterium]
MKKLLVLSYFSFLISYSLFSQNVGIGTNAPNASAQLDITSTNKGVLVPRLTNAQMIAITSPANGLLVYNTDSACFAYRNATAWVFLKGNATASNDWSTKGNAGTDTSKNFIGTTDNTNLIFKRNNERSGLITLSNTSWGYKALQATLTNSNSNTAIGANALQLNNSGNENTATGAYALSSNISGIGNIAIGYQALYSNAIGSYNTASGRNALYQNSAGSQNTAYGFRALNFNQTSSNNTAVGANTLFFNANGYSNVAVGTEALFSNRDRSNLVAIGDSALYNNGTGAVNNEEATANTAIGSKALYGNTTGFDNTAVGYRTLESNSTGEGNTAVGRAAMFYNTSGSSNSAFGKNALGLTSGDGNTAIGHSALVNNTGDNNTAVGTYAMGGDFSAGNNNTALGYQAGSINTGSGNVFLGYRAGESETGSNRLYISNDSSNANNILIYGEFDNKLLRSNGRMEINSDNTLNDGLRVIKNYPPIVTVNLRAIYGENTANSNWGIGVEGRGGSVGVQGLSRGFGLSGSYTGVKGTADGSNFAENAGVLGQASGSGFTNRAVAGYATGTNGAKFGLYGSASGGGTNYGIFGVASEGTTNYAGYFEGNVTANGIMEVVSDNTLNNGLRAIKNYAAGTNKNISAVYGENTVDDNWGIGVEGKGGRTGVQGQSSGTGNSLTYAGVKGTADGLNSSVNLGVWGLASGSAFVNRAVAGEATGSSGDKYGVYGSATGDGDNYGVFGIATGGTTNYAGYFAGNVFANGKLTVSTAAGTTGLDLAGSDAYAEMRVIRNTLSTTDKDLYLGFQGPAGSGLHLFSDGLETVTIKNNMAGLGKAPLFSVNYGKLQVKQSDNLNAITMEAQGNTNHWDFYMPTVANADLLIYYNGVAKGSFSNTTGDYTTNSDRRLKKDIKPQANVLNNVMQLQAYQYHYLDNQPADRFSNGFMAQDVQKLFPDAVVENILKDGQTRLGINYQYFTVLAIKGLQEQQQQIDLLKQQVQHVLNELEILKKK